MSDIMERLAVCSWSLQPVNPADLLAKVNATGLTWGQIEGLLRQNSISVVSGMFGCVGEDYSTLQSIRLTGGIGPDSTWEQNRRHIEATAALARQLGLGLVTFHAGFLPHDQTAPDFSKMLRRLGNVADIFSSVGVDLGLETGQETAEALLPVLDRLHRQNVGVNFDPANMLLYDKGNPVEAARALGPWIRQVHIKDARRTRAPGSWGEEVPAGSGEVDWPAFFAVLREGGFTGNFVIEREAGTQRIEDIRQAKDLVQRCGC
jgi:L-ribulose-5-phosphate 3-epimerase